MKPNHIFITTTLSIILMMATINGEAAKIENGTKVKFHYTLSVDQQVAESSEGKDPLEYIQGQQMIIPGLEKQLAGLKKGDKKSITVSPQEAYGDIDEKLFMEFPKSNLSEDITPQVGMIMQIPTQQGGQVAGTITEIKEDVLVINFNHPLAGKELTFDVEIVEVASAAESAKIK